MNMSVSQHKLIICLLGAAFLILTLVEMVNAGDIIFHEDEGRNAAIYRVSSDGTGLKRIGQGLFPQWSPDRKIITYIESARDADPSSILGLVGIDSDGKEVFRIHGRKGIECILRYSWHPSGKAIAFVSAAGRHYGSISLFDTRTKQIKSLHQYSIKDLDEAFGGTTLEWMPDGKRLLFSPGNIRNLSGEGVASLDSDQGNFMNLSTTGRLPRITGEKILYFVNSELWSMNLDGSEKKKDLDMNMPISSASKVVDGKMLVQGQPRNDNFKLYLIDVPNSKFSEIKAKDYLLFCPVISPDGKKFTAVGWKAKADKDTGNKARITLRDLEAGYYVYDLSTGKTTLLKTFKNEPEPEPFGFSIFFGFVNHSSW